jgi:hypothetical protein
VVINVLNLIVLAVTCAAVFWYTIETRRMQRELVHQRQLSNMPAFVLALRHLRDGSDCLELTNIGNGIAINVTIDNAVIRYPTLAPGHIEFDDVLMIRAGDSAAVESTEYPVTTSDSSPVDGNRNSLTFLGLQAHFDTDVTIRFQDIEGTKYVQTVRMGKSGYRHGFVRLADAT